MESDFIVWLRQRLPPHPQLRLGPGDDAAVLKLADRAGCVVTVDMLMDEVDFHLQHVDPRRVGHKALAVNLSDLAAMAARPVAAVIAVALPKHGGRKLAQSLYEGMLPLAEHYQVALAGGDTNSWDGPLVISVTLIGETSDRGPLLRSGARPGDQILVTGHFGGSILGRHLDCEPRVTQSLLLHERYELHAGIDVSDGLARDLSHIVEESRCGAVIEFAAIPIASAARQLAAQLGVGSTPLDHALYDGEDFELILAVPPDAAGGLLADQPLDIPLTRIGEFVPQRGLWLIDDRGDRQPLEPRGYEHHLD